MLREIFALTAADGFRLFSTAQAIASRQRLLVIHYHNTYDGPTLFFFRYCILMDIFECTQCAISAARFFFKIDSCFRWRTGLRCTLRQRRHAIRRASKPTIVRRYSLLDTPAVYQRASTPPPAPVVIVLRKRSTASRQEGVGNFDPWVR